MSGDHMRAPVGQSPQAAGSVFDLVASKLRRPVVRPGTVPRSPLIERLARGDPRPIVSVVAPPGYGKTTLLSQWAERNGQAFAWVSVDEGDNDPKVLLTYVAEALHAVEPIDRRVFDALASPVSSVPGSVVPRLEDRGGIEGHPMVAVMASIMSAMTARPVDAERLADAVDRWQYGDPARPGDPSAEAWAALLRAVLCRRGVEQMRADADEAVRRFAAGSFVTPTPALMQGIARVLCGDLDGGDASLEDALGVGEGAGAPEDFATALCERSLVAIARGDWGRSEVLAGQAAAVLRQAGIEESFATPLLCAVQARAAMHRGVGADRRRAASAAPAVHPPVVPGDRRTDVPVPQHHQVAGDLDLPEARCRLPQPGGHPVP